MSSFLKKAFCRARLLSCFNLFFIGKTGRASGDCGRGNAFAQTGGRCFALGHDFEGERMDSQAIRGFLRFATLGSWCFVGSHGASRTLRYLCFHGEGIVITRLFFMKEEKLNGGFSGTYDLGQLSLAGLSSVEVLGSFFDLVWSRRDRLEPSCCGATLRKDREACLSRWGRTAICSPGWSVRSMETDGPRPSGFFRSRNRQ